MKKQQYLPVLFLRNVKTIFTRVKDVGVLLSSGLINEESCYPEKPRKNIVRRSNQLLWYLMRYGEILWQYNLYGLDVKPFKAIKEYIGNKELLWREYKYNVLMAKNDYTNIMRDKMLFYLFLNANGFNTPTVFAYTKGGHVYPLGWRLNGEFTKQEAMSPGDLLGIKGRFFCKPCEGVCGRGVFVLENDEKISINGDVLDTIGATEFLTDAFKDNYIIQDVLVQHPVLSSLHASSVNTIRINTGRNKKNGQVEFVTGFIRIGGGKSVTDNMAGGGMAVGIDFETGFLRQYGYVFQDGKSRRIERHPVLDVPFDTIQIPHLKEAVQACIDLHQRLEDLHFIGWDVAITENSISFIEGNDNPELSQSTHGPMRSVIDRYI